MKLTPGLWRARSGSRWYVDWVGKTRATAHNEEEETLMLTAEGKYRMTTGELHALDLVEPCEPWQEPKLRPWKAEDVPVGAILRNIGGRDPYKWMIVAVCSDGITTCGGNEVLTRDAKLFLEKCEHSIDGGKTWLPCGVLEESK